MTSTALAIANVAALTGIAKEVLRKWEVRYGFPVPVRDTRGRRLYTNEQLARLQLIKLLLDRGMRAGQVVALSAPALAELVSSKMPAAVVPGSDVDPLLIDCLLSDVPDALDAFLDDRLAALGLRGFVASQVPAMNTLVGLAWEEGRITVHDEHRYTETLRSLMGEQIRRLQTPVLGPRVLLTTPTGEAHTLGLQTAHVMLALEGADCIALGAGLDWELVVQAAAKFRIEIVGLSFSHSFPARAMRAYLRALREHLPATTTIWAGGAAASRLTRRPAGVTVIGSLEQAVASLREYRRGAALRAHLTDKKKPLESRA